MDWKPEEDFAIRFSDKTGETRVSGSLEIMLEEIRSITNNYGFDLLCYGSWLNMCRVSSEEKTYQKRLRS